MKILQCILYGAIIAHWLANVKDRLTPGKTPGRYAIVGMHSGKKEFIFVGQCDDREQALKATNYLEDNSMYYIALCYDLYDPADRAEFETKNYASLHEYEDDLCIQEVKRLCGS